ncbi:hypothetical protein HRG84_19720 [Flavisolibacter sp. BT320]|nr:hypothetical protein [Flavisolibacter longurius]
MTLFDFLYYSIYRFYSDYNEKGAASTSAGIVGGLQAMNVLTVVMAFQGIVQQKAHLNKLLAIVLFIVFQITTYIRYIYKDNHSVDVMENKWSSRTEEAQKRIYNILVFYGTISIVTFFGLAVYSGSRN